MRRKDAARLCLFIELAKPFNAIVGGCDGDGREMRSDAQIIREREKKRQ